jgi:hypothetical protein
LANHARRALTQSLKRISCCALNMLNIWLGYYIPVWSPGCTTFENQDASKIGSEGRMCIPHSKPTCRRYSGGRACVPFRQSCIVCWLFLRRLVDWQGVKCISTEPPAGSQTGVGLGYTCYGMYESSVSRPSPLAGSQTGMGSGYSWSLYPNSLVDVLSRNRGSGTLTNVMI